MKIFNKKKEAPRWYASALREIENLKDAKELKVGEHFYFKEYYGEKIEFIKISKNKAITAYILDIMDFGTTNDYGSSNVRAWCNKLNEEFGLEQDQLYIPTEEELSRWFPTNEERKAQYSEELIKRGKDDGSPWYWTQTAPSYWYYRVRVVGSSGQFSSSGTDNSYIGVRPALDLLRGKKL